MTLDAAAASRDRPRVAPLPSLVGRRVLIVDDVVSVASSTARLLTVFGGLTAAAHSGSEALRCLAAAPVDLLILDLGLPDVDGREVLARARVLQPTLPVILVSGAPVVDRLGANVSFLAKPFALSHLLDAVEGALTPTS